MPRRHPALGLEQAGPIADRVDEESGFPRELWLKFEALSAPPGAPDHRDEAVEKGNWSKDTTFEEVKPRLRHDRDRRRDAI